jgi:hypothetical protein
MDGNEEDNRGAILKFIVPDALKNCLHETVLDKLTVTQLVSSPSRIDTL